jgi:hypothetical protein
MELTPEDLDSKSRIGLLKQRLQRINGRRIEKLISSAPIKGEIKGFKRLLFPKSYLTPEEEAHLWPIIAPFSGGIMGGMGGGSLGVWPAGIIMLTDPHTAVGGVLMVAMGMGLLATSMLLPSSIIKKHFHTTISASEIAEIRKDLAPEMALENAYLTLMQEALEHQELDASTQKELKSAIKAIGAAIAGMPSNAHALPENPKLLRLEAEQARTKASGETDSVILDSLLRKAEALERSAQTVERSEQVLRRTTTLREELLAQTEALRLHLAATRPQQGGINTETIGQLATSAQAVAREADAISSAKVELENYVVLGR